MLRHTSLIAVYAMLLICSLVVACADTIPKAVWRPGIQGPIPVIRLTPDGSRVTLTNHRDLKIADMQTGECVFMAEPTFVTNSTTAINAIRATEVTSNGEYVVTLDTSNTVVWRRVADTAVISSTTLPPYKYADIYLRPSDTVVFVTDEDSGSFVSIRGVATPSSLRVEPIRISDSLTGWFRGDLIFTVVRTATGDTVTTLPGYYLGVDLSHRVYTYLDSVIIRYDTENAFEVYSVIRDVPWALITRNQFLRTKNSVIDLSNDSQHPELWEADDILPDRTSIAHDPYRSTLIFVKPGQTADTTYLFDGPVAAIVQDPRDSLTFVQNMGRDVMEWGDAGLFGFITDTSTFLGPGGYVGTLHTPKLIGDSLCTVFATNNQVSFYGYHNLDRVRAKRGTGSISIQENYNPNDPERAIYDFSPSGDTLRSFKGFVNYNQCPTDTTTEDTSGARATTGFIPNTPFYVSGRDMYELFDCEAHLELEEAITSIAPHNRFVLTQSKDRIFLYKINTGRKHNSVNRVGAVVGTWSDSGRTVRIIRNRNTILSMHANGTTDSIPIPLRMQRSDVTWQWSNDGCVATGVKRDTLISIDARTGLILREYNNAPWLPYVRFDKRATCIVGHVDGRLVVSLPSGCVATFPGIALPVISSVAEQTSPLRPLQMHGTRIEGATPQCAVTVYSVLGAVVMQGTTDDQGAFELFDMGLPHGAYVVVYTTSRGVRSLRVLY